MKTEQELLRVLKNRFGFDNFRPGQERTIKTLLTGEDVLTVLPTGAGKSLLYQLPAYLLTGTVIIVSPLISLMQDQVDRLRRQGEKRVIMLNGQLVGHERATVLRNLQSFKFVFTSPEMLDNKNVLAAFSQVDVAMLVVDEAHCISQWGPDFRPEYLLLKNVRRQLGNPTTLMLTATATPQIRQDIQTKMGIKKAQQVVKSVDRPNIFLTVQKEYQQQEKDEELLRLVQKFKGPGIVYFASRKIASQMAEWLTQHTDLNVAAYHAGIAPIERFQIQRQFMENELQVICATSAFGMGIDKNDVRFVIHYHLPHNLESYLQEIGRAGRDGKQSLAVLLYADGDEMIQRQLTSIDVPSVELLKQIEEHNIPSTILGEQAELFNFYLTHHSSPEQIVNTFKHRQYQMEHELQEMLGYINNEGCRREYLLAYFGEKLLTAKNNCCDHDKENWQAEINLPVSKTMTQPKKMDWQRQLKQLLNIDEN